jgi:mono/diheme cytochrome c family protein
MSKWKIRSLLGIGIFLLLAAEFAYLHFPARTPASSQAEDEERARLYSEIQASYIEQVKPILQAKCFACHNSLHSTAPWYGQIVPRSINIVQSDIDHGLAKLDLKNDFPFDDESHSSQVGLLHSLVGAVQSKTMPPTQYAIPHEIGEAVEVILFMHPTGVTLTAAESTKIINWANLAISQIKEFDQTWSPATQGSGDKALQVFSENCVRCHNPVSQKGHFGFAADLKQLATSALVNREHPNQSLIYKVLQENAKIQMPPSGKRLSSEERESILQWISDGMPEH